MQDDNATLVTISDGGALRAVLKIVDDRKVVAVYDRDGILIPASKIPNWVWQQIRQRGLLYVRDDALDDVVTLGMRQQSNPPGAGRFSRRQKILFASLPVAAIAIYAIVVLVNALSTPSCSGVAAIVRDEVYAEGVERGRSPEVAEYIADAFCVADAASPGGAYDSVYAYLIEGGYPAEEAEFMASYSVEALSRWRGDATPAPRPTPTPPTYVSASAILRAFRSNPNLGASRYLNSGPVYVQGTVREFNDADFGVVYLERTNEWMSDGFEVFYIRTSASEAARLSLGQTVKVHCRLEINRAIFTEEEVACRPQGPIR